MRKLIQAATVAIMLMPVAGVVFAQDDQVLTGNDFYDACNSDSEVQQAFCVGYLIGVQEGRKFGTFMVMKQAAAEGDTAAEIDVVGDQIVGNCVPKEVEYGQLKEIALNYMREHPEMRHESARSLIWSSYVEAFPC